ncbi:MAG TPA: hypothetical protein VLC12_09050 [Terriglobales bacterium]|nr:hypothetical protein [Terriglobales bacterium]
MLVFRQGRRAHFGGALLQALLPLLRQLDAAGAAVPSSLSLEALLRSGELECALADLGSPHAALLGSATDALAQVLLRLPPSLPLRELARRLASISLRQQLTVATPEGFAYYALHPLQYSELAGALPLGSAHAAVVGIRSIGSTLSAVVAAALRRRGVAAERITVRPQGHPFNRETRFHAEAQRWISAQRARRAEFLVVDEGPGLSGSSFLSVGDALLQAGVPRNSIAFLCAAQPDPSRLRARDAARRWPQFRSYALLPQPFLPAASSANLGGGLWRRHLFDAACNWPGSWVSMERAKFLSHDGRTIFKFEGLGHFGAQVAERARALAHAGFAPASEDAGEGYLAYTRESGLPATRMELCPALLDRLAHYCAFRAAEFRQPVSTSAELAEMAAWNLHEEFGVPCDPTAAGLEVEVPVHADGRMQPHEWLLTDRGLLKTDGASHGDDHFFPGPADIAWDLAGAIVEWELGADAAARLLRRYGELSGDRAQPRLPAWLRAYTAFRLGYCKMAAESLSGTAEEERLLRDFRRYRARAAALLAQPAAA